DERWTSGILDPSLDVSTLQVSKQATHCTAILKQTCRMEMPNIPFLAMMKTRFEKVISDAQINNRPFPSITSAAEPFAYSTASALLEIH
ncbi:putative fad dependent oxidoreductase, partial [Moniliophthora roreri]